MKLNEGIVRLAMDGDAREQLGTSMKLYIFSVSFGFSEVLYFGVLVAGF